MQLLFEWNKGFYMTTQSSVTKSLGKSFFFLPSTKLWEKKSIFYNYKYLRIWTNVKPSPDPYERGDMDAKMKKAWEYFNFYQLVA